MKRIKINGYYILDENCDLSLKEYQPVKVRVTGRAKKWGYYTVVPIEPVCMPIIDNGWAIRPFIVHKKYLSPTTKNERVVIRCPLNMPKFSQADDMALTKVIEALENHGNISKQDILRLKIVVHKMRYVESFNEVNI